MQKNIAGIVRQLVEPVINELGYIVWDVVYKKEGADWNLYVMIDNQKQNININDCEKVHRTIDKIIDDADPIAESYYLLVASPGIERELRTMDHYQMCIGREIMVKLYNKKDYGSTALRGILKSYDKTELIMTSGDIDIKINCSDIAKTNIVVDF